MAEIFISHAVKDKHLAEKLVELLKEGIGVPESAIFCSSIDGHSIPLGEDFNAYMKEQIRRPKLVILLMTPAYMESHFCLMELGAAWSRSHRSLPIVVPPTDFNTVTNTLGLRQAWGITDHAKLIDLREIVRACVVVETRTDHTWEKKRSAWKSSLKTALKKLAGPSQVDAAQHDEALEAIKDRETEIENLQELLEEEKEKTEALAGAKDAEEVKAILSDFDGGDTLKDEFDTLVEAVSDARPNRVSNTVFKHIIMDHFGKSTQINWYRSDKDEFEDAIQYGLLAPEDGNYVDWGRNKLKPLAKALSDVASFLDVHPARELEAIGEKDASMDADDLEFWEYHLEI